MWLRRNTCLLIAAVLVAAVAWSYDGEPTDIELAGWWGGLDYGERIEQLRLLDRVEHAEPVADFPQYDVFVTEDEVILRPRSAATVAVGHLEWAFTLPEQRSVYDPVVRVWWPWVVGVGVAGLIAGFVGGLNVDI